MRDSKRQLEHLRDRARASLGYRARRRAEPYLLRATILAHTWQDGASPAFGRPRTPRLPVAVLAVYRHRNAHLMAALIRQSGLQPDQVHLWALDQVHPHLEQVTRGSGPGAKFELLNELYRPLIGVLGSDALVVADDDVVFVRRGLGAFLHRMRAAGLDLAQPAHACFSHTNHAITVRQSKTIARLTSFVEIGPIFAVSPAWRSDLLPFEPGTGMGFGLDVRWTRLRERGCRLGIVDDVPICHCQAPGRFYGFVEEIGRLDEELARVGAGSLHELQRVVAVWPRGTERPPWLPAD